MAYVERKAVSGNAELTFSFPEAVGFVWLVKNMTDGDIIVAYADEDEEILIPENTAEMVSIRKGNGLVRTDTVIVKPQGDSQSGTIEVRSLRW